jgi:hypothetical protein
MAVFSWGIILLWTQQRTLGFRRISWLAEQLLSSEAGMCSMELLLKFSAFIWEWTGIRGARLLKIYLKSSIITEFQTYFKKFTLATNLPWWTQYAKLFFNYPVRRHVSSRMIQKPSAASQCRICAWSCWMYSHCHPIRKLSQGLSLKRTPLHAMLKNLHMFAYKTRVVTIINKEGRNFVTHVRRGWKIYW